MLSTLKDYQRTDIDDCKSLNPLYYYFRNNPRRFIMKKEGEYYLIVEGYGRIGSTKLFVNTVKELAKTFVDVKSILLIVDGDTDPNPEYKVMQKVDDIGKVLNGFKTGESKQFKSLSQTEITRYGISFKVGMMDVEPSLERVLATFIKNHNIIPDNLCKCYDDEIISNTINELGLKDFEELCKHLFNKKHVEIEQELNRIGLKETICKFL